MMNDRTLINLFLNLVQEEGFFATAIDGIVLMRVDHNTPPIAVLQEPTLVFVLQGQKRGYVGTEIYFFQQGQCLIVSVSMPFDCDTIASAEAPMIAISMKLEADTVNELLAKTYFESYQFKPLTTGMSVIQYDQTISSVLNRLLQTLTSEQDVLVLGDQIKRELLYRVIQHTGADALKGLVAQGNLRPIYKICEYIQHHFTKKLTVEMLAEQTNMSTSAFHKAFKQVTQHSPLQYLKIVRLHKAKQLLQNADQSVAQAAYAVGYQSSSQFSREFKKQFGFPPKHAESNTERSHDQMNQKSVEQMKYIEITQVGGPDVLQVAEGERPEITADEVLIEVYATGINRPDILQRQGLYPMPKGVTPIPGLEVSGVVAQVGAQVTQFKVGDKVCALTNGGGYAEYCAVPANQTLKIPKTLSFVEAAAIPETYFTVWANLFQIGQLKKDESVLIHGGASGIGSTAISLCHAMGIKNFCTVGHDDKVEKLSPMSQVINYKTQDFEKEVLALTDGQGVDVILDIIGAAYFNQNLRLLKRDGRLVIIGFMGGRKVDGFDIQELMLKRAVVTGSTMRARTNAEKAKIAQELEQFVWPLIEADQCKPMIYKTFAFADVAQAHQCLESSQHIGKVVLEIKS